MKKEKNDEIKQELIKSLIDGQIFENEELNTRLNT